ncbi:MAG: hypothetical protein KDA61_12795 [Planctomycetales bacterium]|nr:hypothetical protein [Planctomycetales bacterium]
MADREPRPATCVLDQEFLILRAKALELAAGLDRIQRAPGDGEHDARWEKLQRALEILASGEDGRAERLQLLLSRAYDAEWLAKFEPAR